MRVLISMSVIVSDDGFSPANSGREFIALTDLPANSGTSGLAIDLASDADPAPIRRWLVVVLMAVVLLDWWVLQRREA